jgi:peptide/nickel transport system permease protein
MRAYMIRRVLLIIPTLFVVTLIVFFSVRFVPGSTIDLMTASMADSSGEAVDRESLEKALGFDVPVYVQYGRWLGFLPNKDGRFKGILQGHLGISLWKNSPVLSEIKPRLPVSLELGALGLLIGLILALPIGIYSAIRQDTGGDYVGRTISILFISLPTFWIGTMVVTYPSIWWGWSPPITLIPFREDPWGNLRQFALPAFILGMYTSGSLMRMTRTMMLEVLRQDYIRTAWSKGLKEGKVITRHAVKNALIPVITLLGIMVPILVGGTVILETIFTLPGMGTLLIECLNRRDYPILCGLNIVIAVFVLFVNLLVDLTYSYLDPRVQYK